MLCRYLQPVGNSPGVLQTVIPDALRTEVLADLHEGTAGGHLGADKTLARLRERFYWPGHFNDVREWCQRCAACPSRKSPAPTARAPLQSIVTGRPLQLVATDIVGPLPESPAGNLYILVVADYFTRYVEAYPIPNQEATTVARKLVDEFFLRFSPPEQLHSDQGRNFESTVIAEICKLLGIEKSRTTPYHPQSDGLVERFNRTLLDKLATAVTAQPFQWEQHLRRLCFAYNTSVHPTTGHSPFALMFGRQARLPMDIILGSTPSPAVSVPQYAAQLRKSLDISYASVPDQMGHQLQKQKEQYDTRTQGRPFQVGDMVWLHNPAVPRGRSKKLHRPWTGPYRVAARLAKAVYRLRHPRCRPIVRFNRLKPCPENIRLTSGSSETSRALPQGRNGTPPHPPVGSRVELLDDKVPPLPGAESHSTPVGLPDTNSPVCSSPSTTAEQTLPEANTPLVTDNGPSARSTPSTSPSPTPTCAPTPQAPCYPCRKRSAPVRLYASAKT